MGRKTGHYIVVTLSSYKSITFVNKTLQDKMSYYPQNVCTLEKQLKTIMSQIILPILAVQYDFAL